MTDARQFTPGTIIEVKAPYRPGFEDTVYGIFEDAYVKWIQRPHLSGLVDGHFILQITAQPNMFKQYFFSEVLERLNTNETRVTVTEPDDARFEALDKELADGEKRTLMEEILNEDKDANGETLPNKKSVYPWIIGGLAALVLIGGVAYVNRGKLIAAMNKGK